MTKRFTLTLCALLAVVQLFAQTRTIRGKVVDENLKPVDHASIFIKGSKRGTTTGADGTFNLTLVPQNAKILTVSLLGFIKQEVFFGNQDEININLVSEASKLNEVVVVAYGTTKRKNLTGSVATIKGSTLQNTPVAGIDQALQGQAPGVQVTSTSGNPGGGISVRIRGVSSLSAGNQPLWVIDGVPVITDNLQSYAVGGQQLNPLADLSPDQIQSIDVLKDAAAASLYGSRANNGVILVTTKRGANQKTRITFNSLVGTQSVWKTIPKLTGPQQIGLIREEFTNRLGSLIGSATYPTLDSYLIATRGANNGILAADSAKGTNTDWQKEIFRHALIQNYDLSVSGGNDKTKFYFGGGYLNQYGTVLGSGVERFSLRTTLDAKVTDNFTIGGGISLSRSQNSRIGNDNNIFGVLSAATLVGNHVPKFNADGSYATDPLSPVDNPVALALEPTISAVTNTINANSFGEWKIKPYLTLKSTFGVNSVNLQESVFLPTTTKSGANNKGLGYQANTTEYTLLWNDILTFHKTLDKRGFHDLTVLVGHEVQTLNFATLNAQATNFPGNTIRQLDAGAVKALAGSNAQSNALVSFFTKFDYAYNGKYLLGASFRRDGSSNFGANNRYGNFYSVSAGWNISEENFLNDNKVITNLKLRGSYGTTGNRNIGNFAALALTNPGFNINQLPGLAPTQLGNPNLSWETRKSANIGLEFSLFDRVSITADVYKNVTDNLLFNLPLPVNSGFGTIASNIGQLTNKGLELSLNAGILKGGGFTWDFNANITFNDNKITKLSGQPFAAGFASWVQEGYALGSFRGYVVDRIFQTKEEIAAAPFQSASTAPGDLKFKSLTPDAKSITGSDQKILGNAQPKYYGGFTNTFRFKGLDLNIFAQYQVGNMIYNNTRVFAEGMNNIFGEFASTLKHWTTVKPTLDIRYPRAILGDPNNNNRTSNRWLEDGSYLRIKTVSLGYTLPKLVLEKIKLTNLRFFVQAQNLVTITKYSGFDPEISTFGETTIAPGTDFLTVPQPRTISVGLNVTF